MKVGEVIRLLEEDGWFLVATRGSHRQYKHPEQVRPGYRCRKAVGRFGSGDAEQYPQAGGSEGEAIMRYAVVIEKADGNYSAYVPDLPGCVATAATIEAVE